MSPIEHLWDEIGRHVYRSEQPPTNLQQLADLVIESWNTLPMASIRNVINSMHRRVNHLYERNGGHTRY